MTSSLLLWVEKMRLSAAILCAFLSFSFIAAPTVEAAQKKPAAVKVVKKKAVKKTVVEKTAKKKVVAASAKKKAKAPKAKAAGKRVAVKSVVRKRASARSSSRKFASSKNYRPRKAIDWATYRSRGPSYAQLIGLKGSSDPLGLSSTAVLAYDMDTNQILYEKNADQPLPIASITKLMTALVIVESGVNLDDKFIVTREDFVPSSAHSKLRMGMEISRRQALHLALMSSDNRAAHFLARTYPTGKAQFIKEMNIKAALLGMKDSVFYDSIGLNNDNRSSAVDLSYLITGASEYALIRELSTTPEASFRIGKREVISSTTNRLIKDEDWDIELQKTGLTTAAGYCMVMQAHVDGKNVAFIFLDSPNKYARANDAEKLRSYLSRESVVASN